MKKTLNILSVVDLSVLALWLISFIVARLTAETAYADSFAAAFVIIYAIAAVTVVAYTITSIIFLVKKKKFSRPILIAAYVTNFTWVAVLAMVMYRFATTF